MDSRESPEICRCQHRLLPVLKATLAAAVVVLTPHAVQAGSETSQEARFQRALCAYERNHWPASYEELSALADEGYGPAARMAVLMARLGTPLYATRFEAAEARKQRWLTAATVKWVPNMAPAAATFAAESGSGCC